MSDTKDLVALPSGIGEAERHFSGAVPPVSMLLGSLVGGSLLWLFPGFLQLEALGEMLSTWDPGGPFAWLFASAAWPGFLTVIFSTSVLGIFVIPVIFFARGFSLSLCLAELLFSGASPVRGAGVVFLSAVFSTVALFLLGDGACRSSMGLRRSGFARGPLTVLTGTQIVFSLLLFFLCAVIRQTAIPAFFHTIYI